MSSRPSRRGRMARRRHPRIPPSQGRPQGGDRGDRGPGVKIDLNTPIGKDMPFEKLRKPSSTPYSSAAGRS